MMWPVASSLFNTFFHFQIFDGAFEPGTEKRQICGYNPPQEVFLSETEVVYLRFISDSTNTGAGFNITYTQTRTGK